MSATPETAHGRRWRHIALKAWAVLDITLQRERNKGNTQALHATCNIFGVEGVLTQRVNLLPGWSLKGLFGDDWLELIAQQGKLTENVDPLPSVLVTRRLPPCACTSFLAMESPSPVLPWLRECCDLSPVSYSLKIRSILSLGIPIPA